MHIVNVSKNCKLALCERVRECEREWIYFVEVGAPTIKPIHRQRIA